MRTKKNFSLIPKELFYKIALLHFTVSELKALYLIIGLTFGADQPTESIEISYTKFAELLNCSRQQIINSLKSLERKGYIKNFKKPENKSNVWGINKEFFNNM